jgi:hypothetical protein
MMMEAILLPSNMLWEEVCGVESQVLVLAIITTDVTVKPTKDILASAASSTSAT